MNQQIRRARRRGMSDRQVAALPSKSKRYIIADPERRGHYIRISPSGLKTFYAVARDPYGKQLWHPLGTSEEMSVEDAREAARDAIKRIRAGLPAAEAKPVKKDTCADVANNWLKRYARPKGLRTLDEYERSLRVYVFPHWAERPFEDIKRSDVTKLLDYVEDHHGPRQADAVLGVVRQIARWHASRNDDYVVPIVPGMSRSSAAPRDRILDDVELRALWKATEAGVFGGLVRSLLLTAQRLHKVRTMKWSDVSDDGVWTIPTAVREKGNAGKLKLPKLALEVIHKQPRFAANPYTFVGRGVDTPFSNQAQAKPALDAALPPMPHWTLHDLRRTARSLMSRAGVPSEHSERVLGHVIPGVEGVYDRHAYFDEKADALRRLTSLLERIINPPPAAVADMAAERERRKQRRRRG
jgi:integrase